MTTGRTVWVISGRTESWDEFLYVWEDQPTREEILAKLKEDWPEEFDEGVDTPSYGVWEEEVL